MKTKFNVEVKTKFLKDKISVTGSAELTNVLSDLTQEEVSGRFEDLVAAGILIYGELFVTDTKVQKEFFGNNKNFFEVENLKFSKAKSLDGQSGNLYNLTSKTREN